MCAISTSIIDQGNLRGSLSNCEEERDSWRTLTGWLCNDYEDFKWCENGGVGSGWGIDWKWSVDINGLDARDVCPICGGNENLGNFLTSISEICCSYKILN